MVRYLIPLKETYCDGEGDKRPAANTIISMEYRGVPATMICLRGKMVRTFSHFSPRRNAIY